MGYENDPGAQAKNAFGPMAKQRAKPTCSLEMTS